LKRHHSLLKEIFRDDGISAIQFYTQLAAALKKSCGRNPKIDSSGFLFFICEMLEGKNFLTKSSYKISHLQ